MYFVKTHNLNGITSKPYFLHCVHSSANLEISTDLPRVNTFSSINIDLSSLNHHHFHLFNLMRFPLLNTPHWYLHTPFSQHQSTNGPSITTHSHHTHSSLFLKPIVNCRQHIVTSGCDMSITYNVITKFT